MTMQLINTKVELGAAQEQHEAFVAKLRTALANSSDLQVGMACVCACVTEGSESRHASGQIAAMQGCRRVAMVALGAQAQADLARASAKSGRALRMPVVGRLLSLMHVSTDASACFFCPTGQGG